MKKFRQHFKIAIITPSDAFIQISINFANQVSTQKTAPSWHGIQNTRDNQGTENSIKFFKGKALALQTLKTRNSSRDEIANVNFLYDDIVHALENTIDYCINSATYRFLQRFCELMTHVGR